MTKIFLAPVAAALVLSGCSDFDGQTTDAKGLLDDIQGTGITQLADLPSGRANYDGVAVFARSADVDSRLDGIDDTSQAAVDAFKGVADDSILAADADLTADFDNSTLSGELTDFIDDDDNEFSGTVDIINPNGDGSPNIVDDNGEASISIGMIGTITDDDGTETTIVGAGEGNFGGPDGERLLITTGAGASGGISEDLGGFIVGERD